MKRNFMVSYMENGIRLKFIVQAKRKTHAVRKALKLGAKPAVPKAVQELVKELIY